MQSQSDQGPSKSENQSDQDPSKSENQSDKGSIKSEHQSEKGSIESQNLSDNSSLKNCIGKVLDTTHKNLILDLAFDYYGTKMATCSRDHTVRVWELDKESRNWSCDSAWKGHTAGVSKVTWAHPEFGMILATCSFDRSAVVWERLVGEDFFDESGEPITGPRWVRRLTLHDSRTFVTDVKFGPRHLNLVLATCSADGSVRFYEAKDLTNLSLWGLQNVILVNMPCSCIAWNPTFPGQFAPMIAVGTNEKAIVPRVIIYELNQQLKKWIQIKMLEQIWAPVNDLCFAPNLGRDYHLLAVASEELYIATLDPDIYPLTLPGIQRSPTSLTSTIVKKSDEHMSTVWRVAWNDTGTILASSGDDGLVRLWKVNADGKWQCVTTIREDGTQPSNDPTPSTAVGGVDVNVNFRRISAAVALAHYI